VDKVIQLYEVMLTRHTTMVVGQTGGGKSVIINALAKAQTRAGKRTTLHVINPKAIPVAELYGEPACLPSAQAGRLLHTAAEARLPALAAALAAFPASPVCPVPPLQACWTRTPATGRTAC
jgi:hypothetical protein